MNTYRWRFIAASVLATCMVGCNPLRQQFRQAFQEMKADAVALDSRDDGLDPFGSADAKILRAARAEMGR